MGGRILVRELVSNPMNRTCLVGTLASPLSTCINALVSVRVYTYTACSTICGWVVAPVDNEEMRSGLYGYEVQPFLGMFVAKTLFCCDENFRRILLLLILI